MSETDSAEVESRGLLSPSPSRLPMTDIIVVLPGIMGSVLKKGDKTLWGIDGNVLWGLLAAQKDLLEELAPKGDDVDDGVEAVALLDGINNIPGFNAANGYKPLMDFLKANVDVEEGKSLFPFPYDWRKDNRLAAKKLDALLKQALAERRKQFPNAKVILIGHSMGGLVSRYWLEVLEGWKDCRALITLGTPHRGSLNAVDFLANGINLVGVNLSNVARACTSIFQLLPIYPVVKGKQSYSELTKAGLPNIDLSRVEQALAFHKEIAAGVQQRQGQPGAYRLFPIAGIHQKTNQSAVWPPGAPKVQMSETIPFGDKLLQDGDSTVPFISAVPTELKVTDLDCFSETHGSLQVNKDILNRVLAYLRATQVTGEGQFQLRSHGTESATTALSIKHSGAVRAGSAVRFTATHHNPTLDETFEVELRHVSTGKVTVVPLQSTEKGHVAKIKGLAPGGYQVEVRSADPLEFSPRPVHSVLEVLPRAPRVPRSSQTAL